MQCSSTNKLIVVKTIRMEGRGRSKRLILPGEIKMLMCEVGSHRNIVQCNGYSVNNLTRTASMSLEYCSGGDVDTLIRHWDSVDHLRDQGLPKIFILHFISSMFAAWGYLHEGLLVPETEGAPETWKEPIIHRDIKNANIYLRMTDDNQYGLPDIVLGDFGLACYERDSQGVCGTPGYLSRESLKVHNIKYTDRHAYGRASPEQIQTTANDIYTFGAALYEILTLNLFDSGKHSYTPLDIEMAFNTTPYTAMQPILDILTLCLVADPDKRATIKALLPTKPSLDEALDMLQKDQKEHMPADSWPTMDFSVRGGSSRTQSAASSQGPTVPSLFRISSENVDEHQANSIAEHGDDKA